MDSQAPIVPSEPPEVFPVPQSPILSQSPPPPSKQKDSHWISILAMAIFIVLSLGVVAFLYYQNQALKSMLANLQTPAPVASPSPTVMADPTASWKTYTDKTFGFEFKYPSNAKQTNVDITGMKNTVVLNNFATDQFTDITLMIGNSWAFTNKNANNPNTTIANIPAYREDLPAGQNPPQTLVYFKNGNTYYTFQFTWDGKDQTALTIFDQILSTFKFTPVASAIPLASPTIKPSGF